MKWWMAWVVLVWGVSAQEAPPAEAGSGQATMPAATEAQAPVVRELKPWEKASRADPSTKPSRAVRPQAGNVKPMAAQESKESASPAAAAEAPVPGQAKLEAPQGPVIETGPVSQAPTKTEQREGASLEAEVGRGVVPVVEGASAPQQTVVRTAERPPMGPWDLPVQLDPSVKIKNIHDFLNDPKFTKSGKNAALEFEFKYFNHGAVTEIQRRNRVGQYYVVSWANTGGAQDLVLRLDYRQGRTREQVKTIEIAYAKASGDYKGTFAVTGDEYFVNGQLLSWRIALVRDGVIVAQERSFVW